MLVVVVVGVRCYSIQDHYITYLPKKTSLHTYIQRLQTLSMISLRPDSKAMKRTLLAGAGLGRTSAPNAKRDIAIESCAYALEESKKSLYHRMYLWCLYISSGGGSSRRSSYCCYACMYVCGCASI